MVLARLEAQHQNEVQSLTDDGEQNLHSKKDDYEKEKIRIKEEETVLMSRYAVEKEKEEIIAEEVNLLNSRVTGMERRVAASEENLKKEKSKLDLTGAEVSERSEATKNYFIGARYP